MTTLSREGSRATEGRDVEMGIPDGLGRLFGDPGSLTTEQVRQWLLVLQPHPDRLMKPSAPSTSGRRGGEHTEPTAMHQSEKRQRHELENIRATEEYQIPLFNLEKHLKETTISLSVLQLLQVAPSVRQ